MCELSYVGCPHCNARAVDCVFVQEQTVLEQADLDEDGSIVEYRDPQYSEPHETHYHCNICGHTSDQLDDECSEDDCECRECDPEQAITDPEDPEEIVLLRRTGHTTRYPHLDKEMPQELRQLLEDRTLTVMPVRASLAAEIHEEHLGTGGPLVVIDTQSLVPQYAHTLMPTEEAVAA